MAQQDVLQEFLVSLGFKVNGAPEFKRNVEEASGTVEKLGMAALAAKAAVTAAFLAISDQMEQLYFASQRTGASAENLKAFSFAISQMGGSAAGARESIESLARFMRNSPGGEGLIKSIGVQTRESNGALRDTESIMEGLGKQLKAMPYYRANAYANVLGIDEKTLQALIRGTSEYSQRYRNLLAMFGMDTEEATKSSHEFWNNLREVQSVLEILAMRVVGRTTELFADLGHWFNNLSDSGKFFIEVIGGLTAAWFVLNSAFLRSPVGIILTLGAAILALYDDYKIWQQGGKSLIDWSAWEPAIKLATKGIELLGDAIKAAFAEGKRLFEATQEWAAKKLEGTNASKVLGAVVTRVMAAAGNQEAIEAWNLMHPNNQLGNGAKAPRNTRNNNPGNLMFAGQPGAHLGEGGFAVFDTPEQGMSALSRQLQLYASRGNDTVRGMINTFNPPGAKGNSPQITANYVAAVAASMGVNPDDHIDISNAAKRAQIMRTMIGVEGGGRSGYTAEQIAAGAAATINQTNNITISNAPDPAQTGRSVSMAINDSNARMVREFKTSAQ